MSIMRPTALALTVLIAMFIAITLSGLMII
jgi:hypothetical protein